MYRLTQEELHPGTLRANCQYFCCWPGDRWWMHQMNLFVGLSSFSLDTLINKWPIILYFFEMICCKYFGIIISGTFQSCQRLSPGAGGPKNSTCQTLSGMWWDFNTRCMSSVIQRVSLCRFAHSVLWYWRVNRCAVCRTQFTGLDGTDCSTRLQGEIRENPLSCFIENYIDATEDLTGRMLTHVNQRWNTTTTAAHDFRLPVRTNLTMTRTLQSFPRLYIWE